MKIKRILLTGDDGYNSTGTRLLIHLLRDTYELAIAGTRTQQSAMGGRISLADGFDWCETEVDGIPALCVDGTPGDATEIAATYYKEPFDLVLSGLNWGVNLGTAVFGSGTVNAALRALSVGLTQKAMALSWDLPPKFYVQSHEETEDIQPLLEYPGKAVAKVLQHVIKHNFWNVDFLNVNFPLETAKKVQFTKPVRLAQEIYDYSVYAGKARAGLGSKKQHFTYTATRRYNKELDPATDVAAITNQHISITPCAFDLLNEGAYASLENREFAL